MKTKKFTGKEVKSINAEYKEYIKEMHSPFNVLNWINKNRKKELSNGGTIQAVLEERGIKKLNLSDLMNVTDGYGREIICKVVPFVKGVENYGLIVKGGRSYMLVAPRYTVNDFFKSLNDKFTFAEILATPEKTPYQLERAEMYNSLFGIDEKAVKQIIKGLKCIPLYKEWDDVALRNKAIEMLDSEKAI